MSGFQVPDASSSPPSTPDIHVRQRAHPAFTSFGENNPSTTPAGPPPSSAASFTPVGPPPSSVFGSSAQGAFTSKTFDQAGSKAAFGSSVMDNKPAWGIPNLGKNGTPAFGSSFSSLPTGQSDEEGGEDHDEEDAEGEDEDYEDEEGDEEGEDEDDQEEEEGDEEGEGEGEQVTDGDERAHAHTATPRTHEVIEIEDDDEEEEEEEVEEEYDESASQSEEHDLEHAMEEEITDHEVSEQEEEEEDDMSDGPGDSVGEDADTADGGESLPRSQEEHEDADGEAEPDDYDDGQSFDPRSAQPGRASFAKGGHLFDSPQRPQPTRTAFSGRAADAFRNDNLFARTMESSRNSPLPSASTQLVRAESSARDLGISSIARSYAQRTKSAPVTEPDEIILETEDLMARIPSQAAVSHQKDKAQIREVNLVCAELPRLWKAVSDDSVPDTTLPEDYAGAIGPQEMQTPVQKANYLASLLLRLHHPPLMASTSRAARSFGFSQSFDMTPQTLPMPKVLLDWINAYHNPYPSAAVDLLDYSPNAAAHPGYWEVVLATLLRGKIVDVIRIFRVTDFKYATPVPDDHPSIASGHSISQARYSDTQVGNTRQVINRAIQVLESCPAVAAEDWDLRGKQWAVFRSKIAQANADLATFSEGSTRDDNSGPETFVAENFGIRNPPSSSASLAEAGRKAESKVPWSIYQALKAMYGVLLGTPTEIVSFSQDWLEATIYLSTWWYGEHDVLHPGFRKPAPRRSTRSGESDSQASYLRRLLWSFDRATLGVDGDGFEINTNKIAEVGLACIFEGNVEGVAGIMRSWSLTVTSAVVEIAALGRWFRGPLDSSTAFDQSDLMVLSYGQPKKDLSKDSVLIEYAEGLFARERLDGGSAMDIEFAPTLQSPGPAQEGWEIGVRVLGRLDDSARASGRISELLESLPLTSGDRVDKLLYICGNIGLSQQARILAEKYADSVADSSYRYGEALIYYALARQEGKLKNVLDVLISYCLVESVAYPLEADLDPQLKELISAPQQAIMAVAQRDQEAAAILHLNLTGYATLRHFYALRDGPKEHNAGSTSTEIARRKQAAAALIAVINSAEDNIHGGLFDDTRGAIVAVDGLLALLGEALVFVAQPDRLLTPPQHFALLKAIEDLQTVTPRVYAQCEDFFQSALRSARGSRVSSPRATLKKTISTITTSSSTTAAAQAGFSMIGSSLLDSTSGTGRMTRSGEQSLGPSGVLVEAGKEARRAWDWRRGMGAKATGKDVCDMLRLGLAGKMAGAWLEGDEVGF